MGQRARRIIKIQYANTSLFKLGDNPLSEFLLDHEDTNDFRNGDGGGNIEFPFRVLKEALVQAEEINMDGDDIITLQKEIRAITAEGKDDDDYIEYTIY
jgi:hypothetical protein